MLGMRQGMMPYQMEVPVIGYGYDQCPDWLAGVRAVPWLIMAAWRVPASECWRRSRHESYWNFSTKRALLMSLLEDSTIFQVFLQLSINDWSSFQPPPFEPDPEEFGATFMDDMNQGLSQLDLSQRWSISCSHSSICLYFWAFLCSVLCPSMHHHISPKASLSLITLWIKSSFIIWLVVYGVDIIIFWSGRCFFSTEL